MKKTAYVAMSADVIHNGHINVIKEASKLGDVIVGLLTDEAIATYKRLPLLNYDERKVIIENIKGVKEVIKQETLDYTDNLLKLKPDYVIHGDDWKEGVQRKVREKVIETLNSYGGELIEIPYTEGVNSSVLSDEYRKISTTPDLRRARLARE